MLEVGCGRRTLTGLKISSMSKQKRQRRSDFMKPCNESIKVLLTGWNLTTVGRDEPMNALVLTWCLKKGVEVQ